MSEYEKRITDLEKRLDYAEKLIEKMGRAAAEIGKNK